jgi:hypothetical protein
VFGEVSNTNLPTISSLPASLFENQNPKFLLLTQGYSLDLHPEIKYLMLRTVEGFLSTDDNPVPA